MPSRCRLERHGLEQIASFEVSCHLTMTLAHIYFSNERVRTIVRLLLFCVRYLSSSNRDRISRRRCDGGGTGRVAVEATVEVNFH